MAAKIYESWDKGTDATWKEDTFSNEGGKDKELYLAQTFTIGTVGTNEDFYLEKISLALEGTGFLLTSVVCMIRSVDESGYPLDELTKQTIAYANTNNDTYTDENGIKWTIFDNFDTQIVLKAGTKYAIQMNTIGTESAAQNLAWFGTSTADWNYTGGESFISDDAGINWIPNDVNPDDFSFRIWGSKWEATICNYDEIIKKAGAGANTTAKSVENCSSYGQQAESVLNARTKINWTDIYSTLNVDVKYILNEIVSDLAAIKVINYDMSGYDTRLEAESMIETLRNEAEMYIKELKQEDIKQFVKTA